MILIRLCFPSYSLFYPSVEGKNLREKGFPDKIRRLQATNNIGIIDKEKGIFSVLCSQTQCHFEFTIFEYKSVTEHPPNEPPDVKGTIQAGETSQAGNIAHINSSQTLTPLHQTNIQEIHGLKYGHPDPNSYTSNPNTVYSPNMYVYTNSA